MNVSIRPANHKTKIGKLAAGTAALAGSKFTRFASPA
jgi:hypothetical protein